MSVRRPTAHWILRGGSILFFLMAILGLVGEVLGWWNDVGQILVTIGTLGGIVMAGIDHIQGASEEQVETVQGTLDSMDRQLDSVDGKLESVDGKLDSMDGKLDKLDTIEAALVAEDGETSKLDVVQVELDRQTGVMDRQVEILTEIRDRL